MRMGRIISIFMILLMMVGCSSCNFSVPDLKALTSAEDKEVLIRAQIVFTDGESITAYVKSLGISSESKVYVGGPSSNLLYDQEGNVIGSFNYQRVLYILKVPDEPNNKD
ncbi:MAG: hypothetical protein ACOX0E_00975 [Syntrophomonadaceae bacterium]|jgi:hypothetical protein